MARIRSIKPEFFTSEAIASLPISARLTFIGLWTYVDDNGVGLDNERLIVAAVWPLEDDLIETIQRTREDLWSIAGRSLIARYGDGRRRFIHITSWEEHQRISHPSKPRYPLPADPSISENAVSGNPPESLARHARNSPETLRPEQGAGKGAGSREGSEDRGSSWSMSQADVTGSNARANGVAAAHEEVPPR